MKNKMNIHMTQTHFYCIDMLDDKNKAIHFLKGDDTMTVLVINLKSIDE